jgi:O-antigen/teichoic acid export membrane protein
MGTGVPDPRGLRAVGVQLAVTLAGDVGAKAGVLATTVIAARVLRPVQFGQLVGLMAVIVLASWAWDSGVSFLLTRELAGKHGSLRAPLAAVGRLRLLMLPVWPIAFGGGVAVLAWRHAIPLTVILLCAGASLLAGLNVIPVSVLRARLSFRTAATSQAAGRWITAGVATASGVPSRGSETAFALVALALLVGEAAILLIASALVLLRKRPLARADAPTADAAITFRASLPFATNVLLATAYNRFDVVIVAALVSSHDLSAYAAASRIQDALYLIPASLFVVGLPVIAQAWKRLNRDAVTDRVIRQLSGVGVALAVPAAALVFVFATQIVRLVLGGGYGAAVTPTRVLIWFLPFGALTAPLLAALAASGRAADTTRVYAIAFGVSLALQLALDWRWGATGAATASLARDPAALAVAALLARRAGFLQARARPETTTPI